MSKGARFAQICILLICLALAAIAIAATHRLSEAHARNAFRGLLDDSREELYDRLGDYGGALDALAGLINASDEVTGHDWRHFVTTMGIGRRFPGLEGLGLLVPVEGTRALSDLPAAGGEREPRFVIRYFARASGQEIRGLDVSRLDALREAARDAFETGEMRITPLIEDRVLGSRLLLLRPVFGEAPAGVRPPFLGWTFAALRSAGALSALTPSQGAALRLAVFDGPGADPENLLYDCCLEETQPAEEALFSVRQELPVFGRLWTARWSTTEAFERAQRGTGLWSVLATALAMSAMAVLLVRKIGAQHREVSREVERKTAELSARAEQNRSILENAVLGILLLDEEDRVLEANRAACDLFDHGAPDIVGRRFEDLAPETRETRAGGEVSFIGRRADGTTLRLMCQRNAWRTERGDSRSTILVRDVTDEYESAERLRQSERRWNMALEGARIGVFDIDIMAGESHVSDTWKRLMGHEPDAEIGNPQKVFFSQVHPDDRDSILANDRACIRGKTPRAVSEYRVYLPDGSLRWMRSDAVVAERTAEGHAIRLVGAQTDVTDVRRAQEALLASEERFRLAVAHAPVGTAIIDATGGFVSVNEALRHLFGQSEQDLLDGHFASLVDPDELATLPRRDGRLDIQALLQRANGEKYQDELQLRHRDGAVIWGLVSIASTQDPRAQRPLFIVQVHDITDKKEMEQMKSQFVATVSHELRTPLTSIKGALGIITGSMADKLPRQSLRLLEIAKTNSDRLVTLVNDILDMEKISSGQIDFAYDAEDAAELVSSAVGSMRPFAAELEVHLSLDLPEESCFVWVDRSRTEQVIANLLSNACKFSDPGGTVIASLAIEEDKVRIAIADEGPGVPESFRARLFDPFSQADSSDTREKGGTGLGLNIARRIVERMGGEIGLRPNEPRGSIFWFSLPRCEAPADAEGTPEIHRSSQRIHNSGSNPPD